MRICYEKLIIRGKIERKSSILVFGGYGKRTRVVVEDTGSECCPGCPVCEVTSTRLSRGAYLDRKDNNR